MTNCPNCESELRELPDDHMVCSDCDKDYHYFDYYVEDSNCPQCGQDLYTPIVENDRLIVGHSCPEEDKMIYVAIQNIQNEEEARN